MEYSVKLDSFEGPLDLLLHLIKRYEVNIYDIPVAKITEQYLLYIHTMKELQLDVASEYLVMAATLLAIKSKMLLPPTQSDDTDDFYLEEGSDPREELLQQLLEYKKYKEATEDFKHLEEERGLWFAKPPSEIQGAMNIAPTLAPVSVYDLLEVYQKLLRRKKLQKPLKTKIARQEVSIEQRMDDVLQVLTEKPCLFFDLFPYEEKYEIVITFLAILELMKKKRIYVEQEQSFSDIYVSKIS